MQVMNIKFKIDFDAHLVYSPFFLDSLFVKRERDVVKY